ncbi:MAG: hypothetical protein ABI353_22130 [Isosphaeraceae bacterium]
MKNVVFLPLLLVLSVSVARGEGPADALLKLVPPDAGAVLAVEDLREHARTVMDSPLVKKLRGLPAVKAWLGGDGLVKLKTARRDVEAALGVDVSRLRDDLLGEALVLVLQPGQDGEPEGPPSGLLLLKVRDRELLDRLIALVNESDRRNGTLERVERRTKGETAYSVRRFRPGTKPDEAYAVLDGDVFAWSNSEALIQGVIDRQGGAPGLGDDPRLISVRAALPNKALASLFVNPRFLERHLAADPSSALLRRTLAAVEYAGVALDWRDGPQIQVHQTLDPAKLSDLWKRGTSRPGDVNDLATRVPATALALAAGSVDLAALVKILSSLVPEAEQAKVDNLQNLARGLLLGRDPRTDVLKGVGPGVLSYVEAPVGPENQWRLPVIVALGVDSGVSAALDNALRTVLAMLALDPKRSAGSVRVETRTIQGVAVTTLSGPRPPLAFALKDGRLIVGTTPKAVAAALTAKSGSNTRFAQIQSAYFPKAENFAYVDLDAVHRWAKNHRAELVRQLTKGKEDVSARDLDQALALLGLFRAGYLTSAIGPESTSIHMIIELIESTTQATE